jgi:hypothetical protein
VWVKKDRSGVGDKNKLKKKTDFNVFPLANEGAFW